MRTIAIYGAGPALGMATARRFGHEGFRVALVARGRERLDGMARELAAEGVEAAGFQADLADRAGAARAADAVEARFGPIDVLAYSPGGDSESMTRTPTRVDVATEAPLLEQSVLTPIALVGRVLPGMLERGDGGLLFALGASSKYPMPRLAGAGIALSGLRNYAHTLHAELGPRGVYAGALIIGALIEHSAAHRAASEWGGGWRMPMVSADELAERYWDMWVKRDRAEEEVAPGLEVSGAEGR